MRVALEVAPSFDCQGRVVSHEDKIRKRNTLETIDLPVIDKLTKKVTAKRSEKHTESNVLHDSYHSVYLRDHSVDSVLLKVHSHIAETRHKKSAYST